MIVVDSNVWIAFLDVSDSQHEKAVRLVATFEDEILMPEYVVLEVCTVLKQKKQKTLADGFVDKILSDPALHLATSGGVHFSEVLTSFRKHDHANLSFVDISILLLAKSHTVFTFDKKLAAAIKKAGRRRPA